MLTQLRISPTTLPHDTYQQRYLGKSSDAFCRTVRTSLRPKVIAAMLVCDPDGSVGQKLRTRVQQHGWVQVLKYLESQTTYHGVPLHLLPLTFDRLLYTGSIDANEWWTASMMMSFWRDSRGPVKPSGAVLAGENGTADGVLHYVAGWIDWTNSKTIDCTDKKQIREANALLDTFTGSPHSSERFAYLLRIRPGSTVPAFALRLFNQRMFQFAEDDKHVYFPVASATLINTRYSAQTSSTHRLQLQPRLGLESGISMRDLKLDNCQPVAISHPCDAWFCPPKKLDSADGKPTGYGGLSLHDLEHALVAASYSAAQRQTIFEMHAHLKTWVKANLNSIPKIELLVLRHLYQLIDLGSGYAISSTAEVLSLLVLKNLAQSFVDLVNSGPVYTRDVVNTTIMHGLHRNHLYFVETSDEPRVHNTLRWAKEVQPVNCPAITPVYNSQWLADLGAQWDTCITQLVREALRWLVQEKHFAPELLFTPLVQRVLTHKNNAHMQIRQQKMFNAARAYASSPEKHAAAELLFADPIAALGDFMPTIIDAFTGSGDTQRTPIAETSCFASATYRVHAYQVAGQATYEYVRQKTMRVRWKEKSETTS